LGVLDWFKDKLFSPENIKRTAEGIVLSHFYSPNRDLERFADLAFKLTESAAPSELLLDLPQVAVRLHLYYSKKDVSEAEKLSIEVSRIFKKNLERDEFVNKKNLSKERLLRRKFVILEKDE